METAQLCCDACRAQAQKCADPAMAGQVYLTRSWAGGRFDERCASTMTSNEEGTRAAQPCNVYVFCPNRARPSDAGTDTSGSRNTHGGLCWSNDVWNHSYGECWLKHQADPSRPEASAFGTYPDGYRSKHPSAPERVQWMSGALSQTPLKVDGAKWNW